MDPARPTPQGHELLVHGRFLRGLARALVADAERAEDLVQDTWLAALTHPARHALAPRAWLARILRRRAITSGLREHDRGACEQAAARAEGVREPPALAAEIELSRRVLEAVERLPEPYRSTLYLRYYRGLTPRRMARELGVPEKTVKTRLARGLERLRQDLDRRHGGRREDWVALLLPLARPTAPVPGAPPPVGFLVPLAPVAAAVGLALSGALLLRGLRDTSGARTSSAALAAEHLEADAVAFPVAGAERRERVAVPGSKGPGSAPETVHLRGWVSDVLGQPVAGAEVYARLFASERREPRARPPGIEPEPAEEVRTASDAQGAFELRLGGAGRLQLAIERDGYAPLVHGRSVFRGQALDLGPLVLEAGVLLSGSVLDDAGAPVAGAELFGSCREEGLLFGSDAGPGARRATLVARSDERGCFTVARQAVGPWRLEVRDGTHAPALVAGATTASGERVEGLEITLAAGAAIRGRVLGLEPQRFARCIVLARASGPVPGARPARAQLDGTGAFELAGLTAGEELVLIVLDAEARLGPPERVRAGADGIELRVEGRTEDSTRWPMDSSAPASQALATGDLDVWVRHADGTPAAGALVAWRSLVAPRDPIALRSRFTPRSPVDDSGRAGAGEIRAVDGAGHLRWNGLAAGAHEFAVVSGVFGPEESSTLWCRTTVGADALGALELECAPLATLAGVVRVEGRALARAELRLRPAAWDAASRAPVLALASDAAGSFGFEGLPLGAYRLELFHPDRAVPELRSLVLDAGTNEIVLALSEARLAGLVLDPAGLALGGAVVRALPEVDDARGPDAFDARVRPGPPGVVSDGAGRFELRGLETGRPVRLEVSRAGRATRRVGPCWPGGFQEIVLEPEAELVLELAGVHPVCVLRATGPSGEQRSLELRAGVRLTLRGLAAGSWRLELLARERAREPLAERRVELAVGANTLRWDVP